LLKRPICSALALALLGVAAGAAGPQKPRAASPPSAALDDAARYFIAQSRAAQDAYTRLTYSFSPKQMTQMSEGKWIRYAELTRQQQDLCRAWRGRGRGAYLVRRASQLEAICDPSVANKLRITNVNGLEEGNAGHRLRYVRPNRRWQAPQFLDVVRPPRGKRVPSPPVTPKLKASAKALQDYAAACDRLIRNLSEKFIRSLTSSQMSSLTQGVTLTGDKFTTAQQGLLADRQVLLIGRDLAREIAKAVSETARPKQWDMPSKFQVRGETGRLRLDTK